MNTHTYRPNLAQNSKFSSCKMICNQTFHRQFLGPVCFSPSSHGFCLFLLCSTPTLHYVLTGEVVHAKGSNKNIGIPPLPPYSGQSNPPFPPCNKAGKTHTLPLPLIWAEWRMTLAQLFCLQGGKLYAVKRSPALSAQDQLSTQTPVLFSLIICWASASTNMSQQEGQWLYLHMQFI